MHLQLPKRVYWDPRLMMSDSDESPTGTPVRSTLCPSPSRRRADISRSRASKRLSPDSSSYFSVSSPSSLGSDVGTPSRTRRSSGSPVGSVASVALRELELDTAGPYELHSDMATSDETSRPHRQHVKQLRITVESDHGDQVHSATWGALTSDFSDGHGGGFVYAAKGADGRLLSFTWMCGRDAAVNERLSGFSSWIDLVQPCLDEVYDSRWEMIVHPEDVERCRGVYRDALAKQEPYEVEYRLQTSPDDYRWIMESTKPRFSPNHDFLGYVGWRVDIHEQKSFEHGLKKFMDLSHEILVESSEDGKTHKSFSPSFPRTLGYSADEFCGKEYLTILHPDDKELTTKELAKCLNGKSVRDVENRFRCKVDSSGKVSAAVAGPVIVDSTGTYKWFSWTGHGMYGAGRDITAEKIAREELRQSQAELRRITDAIPGGVFQYKIDEQGVETFPFISKGALSLCSSQQGHAEEPATLKETLHSRTTLAALANTNLDYDYPIVKNGEIRWVRVHAVPQSRENDATKEWCGVLWDITDRHLLEEALREARDVAEKSCEAKGVFLANMSHEIRTPLNAVIGMGVLLLETELNAEQWEYVATIKSSGEALLTIINDILDFSKIEAGKLELEVVPFSLTDCIEDSLDLISSSAAQKGLQITYTISDKVPFMIKGDVSRVRQILLNLLSNAIKFTDQGSVSVVVAGRKLHGQSPPPGSVETRGESSPGVLNCSNVNAPLWEIQFSVKDSGIGIPHDKTHTLFEPFRQLDASTTRKYGGTGLGLAICARICALWGGEIQVESVPGQGSTFHFTVTGEETEVEDNIVEEDYITFLKKKRVLVIAGSNSSTQTVCVRFLKSWHMRVVSAVTADEALQVVRHALENSKNDNGCSERQAEPSTLNVPLMAAIVDCCMVDNPRVMESLKLCQSSSPRIPLILATPFGRRFQDYMEGLQVKFAAHVSKPIKESHLLRAVMNVGVGGTEEKMTDNAAELAPPALIKWTRRLNSSTHLSMDEDTGKKYPLKILIAEDNVTNQKVLERMLLKHGYSSDLVGNGLEAVEATLRQSYDVVLMDCFMPEMDGLEATKHIRRSVRPCPIVVAVTAAAFDEEKKACLQAGLHMYIAKPIKAELLIHTLYKCWQVKTQQISVDSLEQEILASPRTDLSRRPY